ncbi:hypothetical protein IW147_001617 [Coemansia sp. RSA 720]|nr:hypothetical protein IW147_001617 [Coemansia sp. RSA 720]
MIFVAFIKDTIGRDLLVGDEFITEARYDPDYKMVDRDFDNDIEATNVGGDFFKDQKVATNPSLATDSSSSDSSSTDSSSSESLSSDLSTEFDDSNTNGESDDPSTSNDDNLDADKEDGNHGLTQREKAIIAACNIMQRRLCDLTGQWTTPNLFAKSQSIGGLEKSTKALQLGRIREILDSNEWIELVYVVRPDALARNAKVKQKSPLSFEMGLRDSHRFGYVHRERWNKIKRYWGEQPEIEEYPTWHKYLERPRTARKW